MFRYEKCPTCLYLFPGLYYENESETTICFQPNDPACAELNPVSCPPVEVAKQMSTKKANDDKPVPRSCQDICNGLQSCREDPNTHGSYCKVDGSQQTCFGMLLHLIQRNLM